MLGACQLSVQHWPVLAKPPTSASTSASSTSASSGIVVSFRHCDFGEHTPMTMAGSYDRSCTACEYHPCTHIPITYRKRKAETERLASKLTAVNKQLRQQARQERGGMFATISAVPSSDMNPATPLHKSALRTHAVPTTPAYHLQVITVLPRH